LFSFIGYRQMTSLYSRGLPAVGEPVVEAGVRESG